MDKEICSDFELKEADWGGGGVGIKTYFINYIKDIIKISMHYITCSASCLQKSLLNITCISSNTNIHLTNHIDTILRSTFIQLRGIIYHFISLLTSKPFPRIVYQISVAKRSIRNWIDLINFQS